MPSCVAPINVKQRGTYYTVPCGRCNICKENRRNQWSLRLFEEWKASVSSVFVTLTYEDLYLPLVEDPPLSGMYQPMLVKKHIQKLIMDLRRYKEYHSKYFRESKDMAWNEDVRYFCGS